jgi:hypothetical protein
MMSSGIALVSSSSAPSVKVGRSVCAGAALSRRISGGPCRLMCNSHRRFVSRFSLSSGQEGRSIAAL